MLPCSDLDATRQGGLGNCNDKQLSPDCDELVPYRIGGVFRDNPGLFAFWGEDFVLLQAKAGVSTGPQPVLFVSRGMTVCSQCTQINTDIPLYPPFVPSDWLYPPLSPFSPRLGRVRLLG